MIDISELRKLTPVAMEWIDPLVTAMGTYRIRSSDRVAMFLATCLYESNGLLHLEENLNYSAEGIQRVWPARFTDASAVDYAHKPERIANRAYANRNGNGDEASGDGWRYRGRGPIQITGRYNYQTAEDQTGLELVVYPKLAAFPEGGATVSAWFWALSGCNAVADEKDFAGTQGIINRGNRNKTADNLIARIEWFRKVQTALT